MIEIFLRKMKKNIFGRNFMTETLMVQKVAYILASLCEGESFSYLFSVLKKVSYKLGKIAKIRKHFLITLVAQKSRAKKILMSF